MGMNFYAINKPCKHCGRSDGVIHLGKSSIGWAFALQANDFQWYKNWEEMKEWLKGKIIQDKYGKRVSRKEFVEWVENRKDIKDPELVDYPSNMNLIIGGYRFHNCQFS